VDNIVAITFSNVQVTNGTTDIPRISGTIYVDYTAAKITGRLVSVGIGGVNYYYQNFSFVVPPPGSNYSISSPSASGTGSLNFSFAGFQPASLNSIQLSVVNGNFTSFAAGSNELSEQTINPNPNNLAYSSTASGSNHFIDLYNFEASYGDLITAFGLNQQAMQTWYNTREPIEQRIGTFDGLDYVASSPALIQQFASAGSLQAVQDDGAKAYISSGFAQGAVTTFNGLDYIASYSDLIAAFRANNDFGTYHYIEFGHNEGRTVSFDGLNYIASYPDLIVAFGANEQAGAAHFIDFGSTEGRTTTFDGLSYIADYTDLMNAFGANNNAGATHYIDSGHNEGRSSVFTFDNQLGAAAVAAYETAFPSTKSFGANDDAFFTAYIDTYKSTGKFLGQG
jgi:hypothetical protein